MSGRVSVRECIMSTNERECVGQCAEVCFVRKRERIIAC